MAAALLNVKELVKTHSSVLTHSCRISKILVFKVEMEAKADREHF